jgi:biopolymer transport protein ExbB/TolQ
MNIDFIELWNNMGLPVKTVVVVLTVQAVASLAVALERSFVLVRAAVASRAFTGKAAALLERNDIVALAREASRWPNAPLAILMSAGLNTYLERIAAGDDCRRAAELARRAIERRGESLSEWLNRGLGVLASTGSTAPFVGLLGTVLGIIHAFHVIAVTGSGGIGTIGAAIGEALVVTGYGLCVAIPTVLSFNAITGRITRLETRLLNAGGELADRLECLERAAIGLAESATAPTARDREATSLGAAPRDDLAIVEA